MHLLNKEDFDKIFNNGSLYMKNSFYFIDKETKTYQTNIKYDSYLDYAKEIKRRYIEGHTIIVKNLENFNLPLITQSALFGKNVDVHMYLVPPKGFDSFDMHEDDRDVYVTMVFGYKQFHILRNGYLDKRTLYEGNYIHIPKGVKHQAFPSGKGSCLLSFGVEDSSDFDIVGGLTSEDVCTNLKDF